MLRQWRTWNRYEFGMEVPATRRRRTVKNNSPRRSRGRNPVLFLYPLNTYVSRVGDEDECECECLNDFHNAFTFYNEFFCEKRLFEFCENKTTVYANCETPTCSDLNLSTRGELSPNFYKNDVSLEGGCCRVRWKSVLSASGLELFRLLQQWYCFNVDMSLTLYLSVNDT